MLTEVTAETMRRVRDLVAELGGSPEIIRVGGEEELPCHPERSDAGHRGAEGSRDDGGDSQEILRLRAARSAQDDTGGDAARSAQDDKAADGAPADAPAAGEE